MTTEHEDIKALRRDVRCIQGAVERLREGGLRYKTILVLMHHHTGLGQRHIDRVLTGLETLEEEYFGGDDRERATVEEEST